MIGVLLAGAGRFADDILRGCNVADDLARSTTYYDDLGRTSGYWDDLASNGDQLVGELLKAQGRDENGSSYPTDTARLQLIAAFLPIREYFTNQQQMQMLHRINTTAPGVGQTSLLAELRFLTDDLETLKREHGSNSATLQLRIKTFLATPVETADTTEQLLPTASNGLTE